MSFIFGVEDKKPHTSSPSQQGPIKTKRTPNKKKVGPERWRFELRAVVRQKWYHKQRNAIFRGMLRLKHTCGAHSACVVIPDTLNAATFSTSGSFSQFIRAYTAVLSGVRRRGSVSINASITEIWSRFSDEEASNQSYFFDTLLAACGEFADASVLSSARRAVDDEIAFAGAGITVHPRSSQLSALITKALVQYTNDVNADLDAFVAPRADEFVS